MAPNRFSSLEMNRKQEKRPRAPRITNPVAMRRNKTIRYAVVGLGHLSQAAILPAFKHSKLSELGVLVSGDSSKRRILSEKYRVPAYGYDDFEVALAKECIQAAFIVLPNTQHRHFTTRRQGGVHVICEKPMAMNECDCEAMIRAVRPVVSN